MEFNPEIINQLIRHRRSIYPANYTEKVIETNIIQQLLENANWAPTHGITQPWRFTVFTGEGLTKLGEFQSSLYRKLTPNDKFDENKFNKLRLKPTKCSHVISIGMAREASHKIPEIEEIEAVSCAVQNMYLTAAAYGIGCYWGSGGITYKPEANAFFQLPEHGKLLGFFFLGYPSIAWPKSSHRGPIEALTNWVD